VNYHCLTFTYVGDGLPRSGATILAAWVKDVDGATYLTESEYDAERNFWYGGPNTWLGSLWNWHVYAWALLPEAPEVR